VKIVIVGAGAAGLAMGMQLVRAGHRDFTILERSDGVAGTWHDNRYPGAACDVPSHLYCFSFAPNGDWSRKFSQQPEIERYFQNCVERFGLAPHLRLGTEVAGATYDDAARVWRIRTAAGEEVVCDVLVTGTGQLNRPAIPAIPGLDTFAGRAFHSARWDPAFDLAGRTVAVIGTGASAVQIVPAIAPRARELTLFQRSPGYVIARNDRAYRRWERWMFRTVPFARRLYRAYIYWSLEARFTAMRQGSLMARLIRWMALRNLRSIVSDPVLRQKLTPDYPVGCKRILIADDYYQALVRPNVRVVTDAIARIAPDGVVTADGAHHACDTLVFATGFESTHFLAPMEIVGKGGETLAARWRTGAEAHLGITVAGFPNLFLLYGPNTNLGHNSILFMIECQTRYVLRCLAALDANHARSLEVRRDAMARSNEQLQRDLARTAWAADCHSWYKTADGKVTNNWAGRTIQYWWRTRAPDLDEFELG
jgi:cation diffusion facilitator CzcD-associated flavoprotein CzcO